MAQERIDPVPVGPPPVVDELSPFSGPPDSSRVAALLTEEAERSGFPASDHDHVLAARLWRRAGEVELALATLGEVPPSSDATDLAAYETARVMFESGRDAAGGRVYWSACGALDERVRAEIAWDLLPVTTPEEREAWAELAPGEATCDWLRIFWNESGHSEWRSCARSGSGFTTGDWPKPTSSST